MPDIFVNYRTGDGEHFAALIERDLSHRFGSEKIFRASKSIRPGENYRDELSSASAESLVLLVIIGQNWLHARDDNGNLALANEDDWTRKEILNALSSGARIIPILCGRTLPRLSLGDLPPALAPLADYQSLRLDTGNSEADLNKIAASLVELVPGLVDRTAQPGTDPGHVYNSNTGSVYGGLFQTRDVYGSIGGTVIHGSTGPVHSGDGPQYNAPTFQGGVNNYVEGKNTGGIHQNFGTDQERDEDR